MRRPALACAVGAVLLSFGSVWLAAPAALCGVAAAAMGPAPREPLLAPRLVFGLGLLRGLSWLLFEQTLVFGERLAGFRGLALTAVIVGAAYLCVHLRASLEKARFWVLLVLFAVLGVAMGGAPVVILCSLVAAAALARTGPRMTGELAALLVLYQPRTWDLLSRSSVAPPIAAAAALAVVMAVHRAPLAGRGAAALAVLCLACGFWLGHLADAAWVASALLAAAAAALALSPDPACSAGAARVNALSTRP
jgi:hypothetical protein